MILYQPTCMEGGKVYLQSVTKTFNLWDMTVIMFMIQFTNSSPTKYYASHFTYVSTFTFLSGYYRTEVSQFQFQII